MTEEPTKTALMERARELDIEGRSKMSADELQKAITAAESALAETDHEPLVEVAQDRAARREKTMRVIGSRTPIPQED